MHTERAEKYAQQPPDSLMKIRQRLPLVPITGREGSRSCLLRIDWDQRYGWCEGPSMPHLYYRQRSRYEFDHGARSATGHSLSGTQRQQSVIPREISRVLFCESPMEL